MTQKAFGDTSGRREDVDNACTSEAPLKTAVNRYGPLMTKVSASLTSL